MGCKGNLMILTCDKCPGEFVPLNTNSLPNKSLRRRCDGGGVVDGITGFPLSCSLALAQSSVARSLSLRSAPPPAVPPHFPLRGNQPHR